jgi:choline dehydrogenase-like flavoprotein
VRHNNTVKAIQDRSLYRTTCPVEGGYHQAIIIDARIFSSGHKIEADLCIIGSGLAGLTLAREFLNSGQRIAIVEAGGTAVTASSQQMYRASSTGAPNHASTRSRFRAFGGSGTRWTGQIVPFESIDLEMRENIAHSGWPVTPTEMQPYYQRADAVFDLKPGGEQKQHWPVQDSFVHPLANTELTESIIRFAHPRDLGTRMKQELEDSESVSVYLYARLVKTQTHSGGQTVTQLQLSDTLGRTFSIKASQYVLACGGIENPRLLLASNQNDARRLGNEHDQVLLFAARV